MKRVCVCVCSQVFSGSLQCAAALMNVSLRMLSRAAEEGKREGGKGEEEAGEAEKKSDDKGVEISLQVRN